MIIKKISWPSFQSIDQCHHEHVGILFLQFSFHGNRYPVIEQNAFYWNHFLKWWDVHGIVKIILIWREVLNQYLHKKISVTSCSINHRNHKLDFYWSNKTFREVTYLDVCNNDNLGFVWSYKIQSKSTKQKNRSRKRKSIQNWTC